ncbi:MAG: TIGR03663 family protein [Chloroflexi bacterium]|nr:TIGR03663 family protein [Chloroflexota bacterium]
MAISEYTRARNEQETPALLSALTVEIALYAALALIALGVRLFVLGDAPLDGDEAAQALGSWRFINGVPDGFTGSPLLFTGNAVLFLLFGANDGLPRVLPALFGSALVLLPALFRRELGRAGALIASALLAFSPSLVFFSRDTNGAIIAVTCALAALAFVWRYLGDRAARDLYAASVLAALAFLAGREVWTVALVVGVFVAIRFSRVRQLVATPGAAEMSDGPIQSVEVLGEKNDWRQAGLLFALVFVGVGTAFFTHLDGVGAAFNLFGAWLEGLRPGGSLFDPLRLLVVYEPIPLFFSAVALVALFFMARTADRERMPLIVLGFWAVIAFLLYSIGEDTSPARVVALVVPLALIAGWYIGNWITRLVEEYSVPDATQALLTQELPVYFFAGAIGAFLYFVLAEFATRGSVLAADLFVALFGFAQPAAGPAFNGIVLTGLIAIALAAIAFLAVTTLGWVRAKNLAIALALTLLLAWTFRQMVLANFSSPPNPQEWLVGRTTSLNVRDLANDLQDISRWRANDSRTINILVDDSLGPIVGWYLRDFRNARWVARPTMGEGIQALVLPANAPATAENLMSQRYRLELARSANLQPNFLRWLIFRDVGNVDYSEAVLWIQQPQ